MEQQMTGRTQSMTLGTKPTPRTQPPRSALAARSLAAVDRIRDPEQRRVAFARHMTEFPPTIGRY